MDRRREECSSSRFFISSSESAFTATPAVEYDCALTKKGNFSALTVAWIKLAFARVIRSVKKHAAHRQGERGGGVCEREEEREGERERE